MMQPNLASVTDKDNSFDITLFISCYNEEDLIVSTITTVISAVEEVGLSWEIVIIDDVSQDQSVPRIVEYQQAHPEQPIVLHVNKENKGLAYNFVEAAFLGRGKYYRLVCGDNAESKEALVGVFKQIGKAEMVLFYHHDTGRSWTRNMISRLFTGIINLISGYNLKYYNGAPIFLRYHVLRWHSYSSGFGFQADMVTRMLVQGISYLQAPSWAEEKKHGNSTALNFRNFMSVGHVLLAVFIRRISTLVYYQSYHKAVEIKLTPEANTSNGSH